MGSLPETPRRMNAAALISNCPISHACTSSPATNPRSDRRQGVSRLLLFFLSNSRLPAKSLQDEVVIDERCNFLCGFRVPGSECANREEQTISQESVCLESDSIDCAYLRARPRAQV